MSVNIRKFFRFSSVSSLYAKTVISGHNNQFTSSYSPRSVPLSWNIFFTGAPTSFEVSAKPQGCYLALSWEIPSYNNCPITRYTVHYRQPNQLTKWQTKNFIAPNETLYRLKLNCSSTYEIMVLAWNERGSSIKDTKPLARITEEGKSVMCSQSFILFFAGYPLCTVVSV